VQVISTESQTLLGAVRQLVAQSEAVARAEATAAASRLADIAQAGVRRAVIYAAAALSIAYAVGFVLHAAYLLLLRVMPAWSAALTLAAALCSIAGLLLWAASRERDTKHDLAIESET
jgi:Putative Actinobacterial Holin-X, holin superfamily III